MVQGKSSWNQWHPGIYQTVICTNLQRSYGGQNMTILADSLTALRTNLVNFRLDGWKCLDKLSGLGLNNKDWILCIVGLEANEAADKLGNKRVVVADK